MDRLEEIGLLLRAATRESDRRLNDLLREVGITASQAEALQLLDRWGPMSLRELGGLLVAEGGHPSRLVDRMVSAGLVARRPAEHDRRQVELVATAHGRALVERVRERKGIYRAWLEGQLAGMDLPSVRAFFEAYLAGTPLGETVRLRREKGTLADG
ncbi:MarR family winged helix-turn-helix transcriptional regulator [Micromonospora zhanjiangensis]|uniref:MarR family winged helix-turn-helix transcriptional regulator n=1 Tax=Micromonospora zhanjiangensis TaxID=1522057 RepID=A0ABV8KW07_9ACTN